MKRGKSSKWVTRQIHMCVMAICIMEKDIPGCFRRPHTAYTQNTSTRMLNNFFSSSRICACCYGSGRSTSTPCRTSTPLSHNYLIYYHQLQSFGAFPGLDLHLMIFFLLFIIHDALVSFRGYKFASLTIFSFFAWATLVRVLFFSFDFNLYGKNFCFRDCSLAKKKRMKICEKVEKWKSSFTEVWCVCEKQFWEFLVRAPSRYEKLWKSLLTHSIYYQN